MAATLENLKIRLSISDTSQDTLLTLLLDQAKDIVMKYHYGAAEIPDEVVFLEKFAYHALDIAIYLYNKQGVEGQSAHKEQGIDREYGSSHIPPEMFNGIPKKIRTFTL